MLLIWGWAGCLLSMFLSEHAPATGICFLLSGAQKSQIIKVSGVRKHHVDIRDQLPATSTFPSLVTWRHKHNFVQLQFLITHPLFHPKGSWQYNYFLTLKSWVEQTGSEHLWVFISSLASLTVPRKVRLFPTLCKSICFGSRHFVTLTHETEQSAAAGCVLLVDGAPEILEVEMLEAAESRR